MITKAEIVAGRQNARGARNPYQDQIDDNNNSEVTEFDLAQNGIDRLLFESYDPGQSRGIVWNIYLQSEPEVEKICVLYRRGGWTVTYSQETGQLYLSWDENDEHGV